MTIRFLLVCLFAAGCVSTAHQSAVTEFQGSVPMRDADIATALEGAGWKVDEIAAGEGAVRETLWLRRTDGGGKARVDVLDERDGSPFLRVKADERARGGNMFEMFLALRKAVGSPLRRSDPEVVYCVDHSPPHVADASVVGFEEAEAGLRKGFGCWQLGRTNR